MNLYCGNLNWQTTESDLQAAFEAYGEVSSVTIIKDKYTGQSRGFGFVEMANDSEGQAAIEGLNGKEIDGRTLKVDKARPRDDSRDRGGDRY
jgi:RNA recognition motif-containing protein